MDRPLRQRYFTPAEANALLPTVSRLLDEATARIRRFRELVNAARSGEVTHPDDRRATAREAERMRREALEIIEEIQDHGVELKGLDQGLLDFPALRGGVEVLLCWRRGEPAVGAWHPLEAGVAGRRPIEDPADGVWEWLH